MPKKEKPIEYFESAEAFEAWLEGSHEQSEGIWLKLRKKGGSIPAPNYDEALEVALCFGWIDGQVKRFDDEVYLQSFTPRRSRSTWSKRNVELIAVLVEAGRMRPPGLEQVEKAKADGRWELAYERQSKAEPPQDFLDELKGNPAAAKTYEGLNAQNRFSIYYRLQDAKKPETRERRKRLMIEKLERGESIV